MRKTMNKLLLGKPSMNEGERHSTLERRWKNVLAIWNNSFDEDAGLEKLVRLLLAASQFLFPGIYVKHAFWRSGPVHQDLAVEVFVLLKTIFPVVVLWMGWWNEPVAVVLVVWLTAETLLYIPTLIFASDALPSPRSYRRSKLLIFINYLEVVFAFAVMHMAGQYMNLPLTRWTDAVYVSFVITSTIGFGEYYPISGIGKLIISIQSVFYLSYIALFISFFGLGHNKGYFEGLGKR